MVTSTASTGAETAEQDVKTAHKSAVEFTSVPAEPCSLEIIKVAAPSTEVQICLSP